VTDAAIEATPAVMPRRRVTLGFVAGIGSLIVIGLAIYPFRNHDNELELLLVLPVIAAGLLAGRAVALVTAIAGVVVFNIAIQDSIGSFLTKVNGDAVALVTFLAIALAVGAVVGGGADRLAEAARREDETRRVRELTEQVAAETNRVAVLEQVDQQRAALLRSVSHDLRTPLATIRAVASDLRDGNLHDREVRGELLDSVCGEAERLDRLVGNLLSMSRIEAGALQPDHQVLDLGELVQLAAHRLRPLFAHAHLEVDTSPSISLVDGDHSQLDQVLSNLFENAARHAPAGSIVTVSLRDGSERTIELAVIDRGAGIGAGDAEHVFQPFWRGAGSRSSGLGLAIVRAIVQAHDGTVTVEDTPGGGATFVVRLPARDDEAL
jgi:K+-sensing histidine kinase KdpD